MLQFIPQWFAFFGFLTYILFFPIYICFVSVKLQFLLLLFVVPISLPLRLKYDVSFYYFTCF